MGNIVQLYIQAYCKHLRSRLDNKLFMSIFITILVNALYFIAKMTMYIGNYISNCLILPCQ